MQQEYKVQKSESLQDVVIKLYGSLDYQYKFLIDNNLTEIDVTQPQLYETNRKVVVSYNYNDINYSEIFVSVYDSLTPYGNPYNTFLNLQGNVILFKESPSYWKININSDSFIFYTISDFPYSKGNQWESSTDTDYIINVEPYFEPFTIVYDDSIIKSIVPAITTIQTEALETQKAYTTENNQSFFDISIITTGGLNNIIALANQNNVDINTFNSQQTKSISYYIEQIENRINYNFMQTLQIKPATETYLGINSSTHVAFNESFNISFG